MNRDSQRPTRPPPPVPEGEQDGEADRATVVPSFDLAEFARQKMLKVETAPPPMLSSMAMDLGELFRAGDHDATLALSEALLQQDPDDIEARRYAEMSRMELTVRYLAAFGGSGSAIPRLKASIHGGGGAERPGGVYGEVLAEVDGMSSVEEIVLTMHHDRLVVLSALCDLLQHGIIEVVA